MAFSAILSGVTIGASITTVALYPCTGSTNGTCSGTVIPNYGSVARSSIVNSSLTINDIPDGTTNIKLVASGGGCTPDYILPISNIPGASTPTPTPTIAGPTVTPTATIAGPTVTPTATILAPSPSPSPTPAFKTIQISNPQTTAEGACGVSSGLTKYISSAYSNITNGIVVYNEDALTNKYLPNGDNTGEYWPIIFNGTTFATTFAVSDAGAISTVTQCDALPTYEVSVDKTSMDETPTNNTLTVTVNTTNVPNGTELFWTFGNGASYLDYQFDGQTYDVFITNNVGTFTITALEDLETETNVTFTIEIRIGNTAGTVVATTDTITLNDTSLTPPITTYWNVERCDNPDATGVIRSYNTINGITEGMIVMSTNGNAYIILTEQTNSVVYTSGDVDYELSECPS
jgi:hypothetical protein